MFYSTIWFASCYPQPSGGQGRKALLDHEAESAQIRTLPKTSPSTPAAWLSPERPSYKWWVTVALMLGILTQGLNFGTVNVALPSMMTSLQAEVETIQWVVTSFMITHTVVMPTVGWVVAVLAYRDCYLAIACSSLVSLGLALFLSRPQRHR